MVHRYHLQTKFLTLSYIYETDIDKRKQKNELMLRCKYTQNISLTELVNIPLIRCCRSRAHSIWHPKIASRYLLHHVELPVSQEEKKQRSACERGERSGGKVAACSSAERLTAAGKRNRRRPGREIGDKKQAKSQ